METKTYKLTIRFTTDVLGSQPGKDTIGSDWIREAAKKIDPSLDITQEEKDSIPELIEKACTGFYRDKAGKPILRSYQIKGMIKEAGSVNNGLLGVKNLRSKLDNLLFVSPMEIEIRHTTKPDEKGGILPVLQRPLRCMTMQGPRVSIAMSERIDAGAEVTCLIKTVKTPKEEIKEDLLRELLDYAALKGFGQWRNSGEHGQFEYDLAEAK